MADGAVPPSAAGPAAVPHSQPEQQRSAADLTLDPKAVNPQKLMVVTTKFLRSPTRSRGAAKRLLDCIQEKINELPVVFLADVVAAPWPAGVLSDTLRVAIRRRVMKGAMDLSGADVSRVFIAWTRPLDQRGDVSLFRRLGKLLAFSISDVQDALLLRDLLVAIRRAKLRPPPGFLALVCRRVHALDRASPLTVADALGLVSVLSDLNALERPTATVLINRIVLSLRSTIEAIVAIRSLPAEQQAAALAELKRSVAGGAATPAQPTQARHAAAAAADEQQELPSDAPSQEETTIASVASKAGIDRDAALIALRDINREDTAAIAAAEAASVRGFAAPGRREPHWPLTGSPMAEIDLTATEASFVCDAHGVRERAVYELLPIMHDHRLSSPLYNRPVSAIAITSLRQLHPLEVLRFVREGGLNRVGSPKFAVVALRRLQSLELDVYARALVLRGIVGLRCHMAKERARAAASSAAAADSSASGEPEGSDAAAAASAAVEEEAELVVSDAGTDADAAALDAYVKAVAASLDDIGEKGMTVRVLIMTLEALTRYSVEVDASVADTLRAAMPRIAARMRQHVEGADSSLEQCDAFLDLARQLRYQDASSSDADGDLAAIKLERQLAEDDGRKAFMCKVQSGKHIYKELQSANNRLQHRTNMAGITPAFFSEIFRLCRDRHPMSVLEALKTYEEHFPKTLSPSLRREVARALLVRLRPGVPAEAARGPSTLGRAVPLTAEEWPRFVQLVKDFGPESLVTAPSLWRFVLERNAMYGGNDDIRKYAEDMLAVFDRRR